MRIQHNISAILSLRTKRNSSSKSAKTLERLASGYQLNRAADDTAGLAISEKMRATVTGLSQAIENSSNGVSLIQIAEGAMDEIHGILNRMTELADQSMNGTYVEMDREALDREYQTLLAEIDRIAEGTAYEDIKLLNGNYRRPDIAALVQTTTGLSGADAAKQVGENAETTGLVAFDRFATVVDVASQRSKAEVEALREKARAAGVQVSKDAGAQETKEAAPAAPTRPTETKTLPAVSDGKITIGEDGVYDLSGVASGTKIEIAEGKNVEFHMAVGGAATPLENVSIVCGKDVDLHLNGVNITSDQHENIIDFQGTGCTLDLHGDNQLVSTAKLKSTAWGGGIGSITTHTKSAVVHVGNDAELAIFGDSTGTLMAQSTDRDSKNGKTYNAGGAVIGGNAQESGGKITVYGGKLDVIVGDYASGAGIGGGAYADGGDILIAGGTVNIQAKTGWGAGIGGGGCCGYFFPKPSNPASGGNGGNIRVTGGEITINNHRGAGIGGGVNADGGKITIDGGTIQITTSDKNTSSDVGAGIGGGGQLDVDKQWSGHGGDGGDITINGGSVTIEANGSGAGMGGGGSVDAIPGNGGNAGDIKINGGTVQVTTNKMGAGIGGGYEGKDGGTITISGDDTKVTVTANGEGAGMGGGREGNCGSITVQNGTVEATTTGKSAAMGSGVVSTNGNSATAGTITVSGGTITAITKGNGAAMGSSTAIYSGQAYPTPNVIVEGGTVNAFSQAGANGASIGGAGGCFTKKDTFGVPSAGGNLTVTGGVVNINSDSGGWIGGGKDTHTVDYADDGVIHYEGGIINYVDNRPTSRAPEDPNRPTTGTPNTPIKKPVSPDDPDGPDHPDKPVKPDKPVNPDDPDRPDVPEGPTAQGGLLLHIGEGDGDHNLMNVYIEDMHVSAMGLKETNVRTQNAAQTALDACRDAINYVSSARADMGAYQNRLEHNISSLRVTSENTTAAESVIRDANIAQEMLDYTKQNILNQSAQAMYAQALHSPEGVLQLLQ